MHGTYTLFSSNFLINLTNLVFYLVLVMILVSLTFQHLNLNGEQIECFDWEIRYLKLSRILLNKSLEKDVSGCRIFQTDDPGVDPLIRCSKNGSVCTQDYPSLGYTHPNYYVN